MYVQWHLRWGEMVPEMLSYPKKKRFLIFVRTYVKTMSIVMKVLSQVEHDYDRNSIVCPRTFARDLEGV